MLYEFEFYFNPWALIHALGKIDGERQLLRIGENSVYCNLLQSIGDSVHVANKSYPLKTCSLCHSTNSSAGLLVGLAAGLKRSPP